MVPTRKQIGRKCNRIDGPDTKPSSHRSVSFDEDAKKKIHWSKDRLQKIMLGKVDIHMWKGENSFLFLAPFPALYKNQLQIDQRP